MKRKIAFVLAALFFISVTLTSCEKPPVETDGDYPYAMRYKDDIWGIYKADETEELFLYWDPNDVLMSTDKKTLITAPVCDVPGCIHAADTDSLMTRSQCKAWGFQSREAWAEWNGYVYFVEQTWGINGETKERRIMRIKVDGTEREYICQYGVGDGPMPEFFIAHRGMLYFGKTGYTDDGQYGYVLYRLDIEHESDTPEMLLFIGQRKRISDVCAYGDSLYYIEYSEWEADENGKPHEIDAGDRVYHLMRFDLKSGEEIELPAPEEGYQFGDISAANGKLLIEEREIIEGLTDEEWLKASSKLYLTDLDGENKKLHSEGCGRDGFATDGQYIFRTIVTSSYADEQYADVLHFNRAIEIYDMKGKLLQTVPESAFNAGFENARFNSIHPGKGDLCLVIMDLGSGDNLYLVVNKKALLSGSFTPTLVHHGIHWKNIINDTI